MLPHLTDASIRSLLLALPAAIVLWTFRGRRTAALQHAVWTSVVCGMLALFAFGQSLPRLPVPIPDQPAVALPAALPDETPELLHPQVPHANNFIDRGPMQRLADVLSSSPNVGRPALDKTGLTGVYLFFVSWEDGEEFLTAMQEQLGLKLESQKAPMDACVVDRVQKPDAN